MWTHRTLSFRPVHEAVLVPDNLLSGLSTVGESWGRLVHVMVVDT